MRQSIDLLIACLTMVNYLTALMSFYVRGRVVGGGGDEYIFIFIYIYVSVCAYVCVCICTTYNTVIKYINNKNNMSL